MQMQTVQICICVLMVVDAIYDVNLSVRLSTYFVDGLRKEGIDSCLVTVTGVVQI